MSYEFITTEVKGRVALITLNRPKQLNALNAKLMQELGEALYGFDADDGIGAIVIAGSEKAFAAGADIGAMKDFDFMHAFRTDYITRDWEHLRNVRKPVIAAVAGYALGGGCELAMMCDLAIAADDALFGEPEIRFSNVGPALVLPFVVGQKRAREILYFGDPIDARTALQWGMVNRVVPRAELEAATLKFARRLALISPESLAATKRALNRGADAAGFRNAIRAGLDVLAPLYAATTEVGKTFDEIREKEGLGAALRWRAAQFAERGGA